jgi:hypothetical protein
MSWNDFLASPPSSQELDDFPMETDGLEDTSSYSDEMVLETPVQDPSVLLSLDLTQTKGWVLGRAGFHGHLKTVSPPMPGFIVLPISELGLIRNSRSFKHLVFLPTNQEQINLHPEFAQLLQVLQ